MNQDKKTVKPESTQGKMKNKVFQIRLKSNQEAKLNENFVGVVEQEFATKYLESLNIEPTQKNIMMILKSYPLKKCNISAGWNNAGMLADTITIVARKDKAKEVKIGEIDKKNEKGGKGFFSNEFVDEMKKVGLKTINIDSLYKNIQRNLAPPGQREVMREENEPRNDEEDGEVRKRDYHDKRVFHVDFNLESIKSKYLFPFNVTKEKRNKAASKPMTAQNQVTLLTSNEFQFPFSVVNVNVGLIKELQSPLNVTYEVIKIQIERFCNEFPFAEIFPTKKMTRKPTEKDIMMGDTDPEDDNPFMRQLNFLKKMLKSDTNIRFIGLNGHYCYWMVFGHTSPFELDSLFKKQILITLFEVLDTLRDSFPSDYAWANFDFPFILLCLRMLLEYIFRTSYPGFFEKAEFAEITLESINELLTKMYDPNNLFSRLVYLESEIKAVRKRNDEHIDESKMMKKRLFGVSPFMDMVIPNPAEGRVRSLFSMRKKQEVGDVLKPKGKRDESVGKTEMTAENEEKAKLEKVYDMRLLYVLLNRISNNVAQKIGAKASNIVSLPKVTAPAQHPNTHL